MMGRITDMKVASKTSAVLLAAVPDYNQASTLRKPLTSLYNRRGRLLWQKTMRSRVRHLEISENHQLTLLATYDENLRFINARGVEYKTVKEAFCRPRILNIKKMILCFYDDESNPNQAFDVFDFTGRNVYRYSIDTDAIHLKTSQDEKHHLLAYVKGKFDYIDQKFKKIWTGEVPGEIIDFSVSNGVQPKIAVLYQEISKKGFLGGQRLLIFDHMKNQISKRRPSLHSILVDFGFQKNSVRLFGNYPDGQHVLSYPVSVTNEPKPSWIVFSQYRADFPIQFISQENGVLMGLEKIASPVERERKNFILGINNDGELKWGIGIDIQEGLYLFGLGRIKKNPFLAVVSDRSLLRMYKIK